MSTNESTPDAARHPWLRLALAVVAALTLLDSLGNLSNLWGDYHQPTPYLRFAQALTGVGIVLTPLIAAVALVLAGLGRPRQAILALAALTLTLWLLDDVAALPIRGLEFSADFGGVELVVRYLLFPAVAIAGALLALKRRRLALAGLLVCLPMLFLWASVVLFTITVLIYGF